MSISNELIQQIGDKFFYLEYVSNLTRYLAFSYPKPIKGYIKKIKDIYNNQIISKVGKNDIVYDTFYKLQQNNIQTILQVFIFII